MIKTLTYSNKIYNIISFKYLIALDLIYLKVK
jgi:hypothetical protein